MDGETAPLLLMRSVLLRARADLETVLERWGNTAIGAVARAWADHRDAELPPVPFPRAIAPRLAFHAAADSAQRVRPAADSFDALEPVAPGER